TEQVYLIQGFARTHHYRGERVIGERHGQSGFFAQQDVEITQQRATAGKYDSLVHDVGGKFRWRALKRDTHRFDHLMDRLHQHLPDLFVGDLDHLRPAGHEVAALALHRLDLVARIGSSDRDLEQFGRAFADEHIVLALDVLNDGLVHFVARDPHR